MGWSIPIDSNKWKEKNYINDTKWKVKWYENTCSFVSYFFLKTKNATQLIIAIPIDGRL